MLSEKLKLICSRNWISTWLLFFVVAAAPFPFGSTSKSAIAFWCIPLSVAVVLLSLRGLRREILLLVAGLFLIVAGYGFVLHEQLSDHPWIAPFHPIWSKASDLLGTPLAPSASITKNLPFFAIGATLANILSLLLGMVIGSQRDRARQIMMAIAYSGVIYAVYGIASFLIEPTMLLWREKTAYIGSLTGTFVNRNSAAAYFGSCAVIWLLLLVETVRRKIPERRLVWSQLARQVAGLSPRDYLPAFGAFLSCLVAMFLTTSRAGVGLSLLAMIVSFTVLRRKDLPPRIGVFTSLGAGVVVSLGLLQLFGGRVSSRFDSQGLVDEGRIEAWKSAMRIIADYPWFGTGLGTFVWSFPPYRSAEISMRGIWDAAHSTPLELASEVGLPLTGLVGFGWLMMFAILARGSLVRRRGAIVPLAALAISSLALLHSCIDFTLQVPGYSIPFFALFGAGLAQSFRSRRPDGRSLAVPSAKDAMMRDATAT